MGILDVSCELAVVIEKNMVWHVPIDTTDLLDKLLSNYESLAFIVHIHITHHT